MAAERLLAGLTAGHGGLHLGLLGLLDLGSEGRS